MTTYLEEWLFLARTDLQGAGELCKSPSGLFHISVYLAHQAVEKILKAFLVSQGMRSVPRTHHLGQLFRVCLDENCHLDTLQSSILELDLFLPRTRYPEGDRLTETEANRACFLADLIVQQVIAEITKEFASV